MREGWDESSDSYLEQEVKQMLDRQTDRNREAVKVRYIEVKKVINPEQRVDKKKQVNLS